MRHTRVDVTIDYLKSTMNNSIKPIYIQVGYNRFAIGLISEEDDHILLVAEEDADNPIK
ncbi:hypothetical protein UFOVP84_94 [uncultured Caudovirales phage]|uniref:Uncharacterized protein n=1 Tax=uncultured Caudovirales phage TaxID=2100421 RepID=A0A6J5L0Z5_9CAUD|nr:hypothetical protein UFOVP84_94 [uncultured Caudovirales phage]